MEEFVVPTRFFGACLFERCRFLLEWEGDINDEDVVFPGDQIWFDLKFSARNDLLFGEYLTVEKRCGGLQSLGDMGDLVLTCLMQWLMSIIYDDCSV